MIIMSSDKVIIELCKYYDMGDFFVDSEIRLLEGWVIDRDSPYKDEGELFAKWTKEIAK